MESIIWSLISQAIVFYCGYKLGQHITAIRVTRMLIDRDPKLDQQIELARKEIQRLQQQDAKSADSDEIEPLRIERIGDQLYVYQKDSNEFLAQGSSLEEALDRIEQRFPDRDFRGHLTKEQADSLGINSKQG